MASALPARHRALVLASIEEGFHLKHIPTPQPGLGNAVVRVVAAGVLSDHRAISTGARRSTFPTPIVGGYSSVGRVAAVGPDATALTPGQLVYCDCVIHGGDDPDTLFLTAIHDSGRAGSARLMRDVWRDGPFAEYVKVPLENCIALDEARLCGGLGYTIPQLAYLGYLLVPFGGLRDIHLAPGETVVVSPATGGFGGAGVRVAVAMGARVIAMGRDEKKLAQLKEHVLQGAPHASIETVPMTGDETADMTTLRGFGTIDAALDFSPPQAAPSTHLRSAIRALRRGGRVSLMGFCENLMCWEVVAANIAMKGKLMYERPDMVQCVKMLERGLFPRGAALVDVQTFPREEWHAGLDAAAAHVGRGKTVVLTP